jgi:hypothetical protein
MSLGEIQAALVQVGGIYSKWTAAPLSEALLRQELANGRPVIVDLQGSFSAHVILVTGFDGAGYHVQDPYSGDYTGVPYQLIRNNPQIGVWAQTLHELGVTQRCSGF